MLRTGRTNLSSHIAFQEVRKLSRWGNQDPALHFLNDFDTVLQCLYAKHRSASIKYRSIGITGSKQFDGTNEKTELELLVDILNDLIPNKLYFNESKEKIEVYFENEYYPFHLMSDGERSLIYTVGQVLLAEKNSLLIFDEPEIHIHRSIMAKLWDKLEEKRSDCAFMLITHDLEFAASRTGKKYVLNKYNPKPYWDIKEVPDGSGFDEELLLSILGARKPVLFVEGKNNSLDFSIYSRCYPDWQVIPAGSCDDVIKSVKSFKEHADLTRIKCAGIIDSDDRSKEDIKKLEESHIYPLSVSEIENIFLIPNVSSAIAKSNNHEDSQIEYLLKALKEEVFRKINPNAVNKAKVNLLKKIVDDSIKNIHENDEILSNVISKYIDLNFSQLAKDAASKIDKAIKIGDLTILSKYFRSKGIVLSAVGQVLKSMKKSEDFKDWITRTLSSDGPSNKEIVEAIQDALPNLPDIK